MTFVFAAGTLPTAFPLSGSPKITTDQKSAIPNELILEDILPELTAFV